MKLALFLAPVMAMALLGNVAYAGSVPAKPTHHSVVKHHVHLVKGAKHHKRHHVKLHHAKKMQHVKHHAYKHVVKKHA
ncbi:hypothetical protein [uncultured Thiothrix sp.]|uniref:hypothetical protein n=1 Tax=uncultured Thiothrix sp. TaxID=223185 RepID=UPI002633DA7B|nr:hypothetical protein [uncultured Thiothrix sp.]